MGIKVTDDQYAPLHGNQRLLPRILSKHTEDVFEHRDGIHKAEFDHLYSDALQRAFGRRSNTDA